MRDIIRYGIVCAALMVAVEPAQAQAQDPVRREAVHFPAGASGTKLSGKITGREMALYTLGAEAGQSIEIALNSPNTAAYFNIYAPGMGPGDEALAAGPMLVDLNRYAGTLPQSGIYTISVYLYGNAARNGETASYRLDVSITGVPSKAVQADYADGLQGGPDYWAVSTSTGGPLNLREAASLGAGQVVQIDTGTKLRNLGCRMAEGRQWCHVATLADPGDEGWAAGDFLIEASTPVPVDDALVPGTEFNATGTVRCVPDADTPETDCDFGVKRGGNGDAEVTITLPDGRNRLIVFREGKPADFDRSEADGDVALASTREDDNSIVTLGQMRFVIPDVIPIGD